MKRILLAFQFLTIIPVKVKGDISEKEIGGASAFFPFVGVFQGALLVTANFVLEKVFPAELTNGLLVLLLVLSNGGFHLDGLSDTFDAIAAKSEGNIDIDRQKRLSIMKDSTVGPIGVIAVVFTLLLKFLALNSLSHFSLFAFHSLLFLMPILPKWTMVISMFHGKPAKEDGLGKIFLDNIRANAVIFSSFLVILFYILIVNINLLSSYKVIPLNPPLLIPPMPPFSKRGMEGVILFFITLFILLYIFSFLSAKFCTKKFGGLTGDTLGAISEITEIIFLLMVIAWLRLSI